MQSYDRRVIRQCRGSLTGTKTCSDHLPRSVHVLFLLVLHHLSILPPSHTLFSNLPLSFFSISHNRFPLPNSHHSVVHLLWKYTPPFPLFLFSVCIMVYLFLHFLNSSLMYQVKKKRNSENVTAHKSQQFTLTHIHDNCSWADIFLFCIVLWCEVQLFAVMLRRHTHVSIFSGAGASSQCGWHTELCCDLCIPLIIHVKPDETWINETPLSHFILPFCVLYLFSSIFSVLLYFYWHFYCCLYFILSITQQ